MLPWLIAYTAVLVVWALFINWRTTPTLWQGSALVIVNSVFVIATIIYGFLNTFGAFVLPGSVVLFDLALVVMAIWVRRKWLLVGITREQAGEILESCFSKTRSSATRREHDYVVRCGDVDLIVGIHSNRAAIGNLHLPMPGHTIRFSGASASKKAKLIRSLFTKHFSGSFPTPRIKA